MNYERFIPLSIHKAFTYEPPGSWMTPVPKDCIRLNAGYPAPDLVPAESFGYAAQFVLSDEGDLPLQYLGSSRMKSLRERMILRMHQRGMRVTHDEFFLTSGAYQAIDVIAHVL